MSGRATLAAQSILLGMQIAFAGYAAHDWSVPISNVVCTALNLMFFISAWRSMATPKGIAA